MTDKVRCILNLIDDALVTEDDDAVSLWNILTALRGPDDAPDMGMNKKNTCVVRYTAFPRTAKRMNEKYGSTQLRAIFTEYPPAPLDNHTRHYNKHIIRAFKALGIEVPSA